MTTTTTSVTVTAMAVMRGVGRIHQQENKPALGYISSPFM